MISETTISCRYFLLRLFRCWFLLWSRNPGSEMKFWLKSLPSDYTVPELWKQFYEFDLKAFQATEQNECNGQQLAWAVVKQTAGYKIAAKLRRMQSYKHRRMEAFDVLEQLPQGVDALWSKSFSWILIKSAENFCHTWMNVTLMFIQQLHWPTNITALKE